MLHVTLVPSSYTCYTPLFHLDGDEEKQVGALIQMSKLDNIYWGPLFVSIPRDLCKCDDNAMMMIMTMIMMILAMITNRAQFLLMLMIIIVQLL